MADSHAELWDGVLAFASELMEKYGVPGVVVGIKHGGETRAAGLGVTNVDHPLPVTDETLFQVGSISKTFTTVIILRLVELGQLDLDAPVRQYAPEFKVADERVSAQVTVRQLLTHTAGWFGDFFHDTGAGDDAMARYVADMAELEQITPLGGAWSYNNAAFYLAGHIIEVVTGRRYEAVLEEWLLGPLGLAQTFLDPGDLMTYRFAVGHEMGDDGTEVARPWPLPRAAYPVGGITCSVHDLLRYARFHMGDGTAEDGASVLAPASLALMQTPQALIWGEEHIGLSWFIEEIGGSKLLHHGGGTKGQVSLLTLAPARDFAMAIFTNADRGGQITYKVTERALKQYLAIEIPEPQPTEADAQALAEFTGLYVNPSTEIELGLLGGRLISQLIPKRGFPSLESPVPPPPPPLTLALCEDGRLLVMDGPSRGDVLHAGRGPDGSVDWLRVSGRIHVRREKATDS
jgi:CubicO group peptidase (beta-lactamase class C family)